MCAKSVSIFKKWLIALLKEPNKRRSYAQFLKEIIEIYSTHDDVHLCVFLRSDEVAHLEHYYLLYLQKNIFVALEETRPVTVASAFLDDLFLIKPGYAELTGDSSRGVRKLNRIKWLNYHLKSNLFD